MNPNCNSIFFQEHNHLIKIYLLFYVAFNSQGHIATGSLQAEETSAYCTVNHRASASNYQLSNMKRPARDSNRWPQRLEERTLTATPPSPLSPHREHSQIYRRINKHTQKINPLVKLTIQKDIPTKFCGNPSQSTFLQIK